jgi:putative ABC transport system substrate-binding protein
VPPRRPRTVGAALSTIEVATPGQILAGFETAVAEGAHALVVLARRDVLERARTDRGSRREAPDAAIYPEREYVEEGGLLAYGSNSDQWRRRATYVDKILKGDKPGDLPLQQPVKFDSEDRPEAALFSFCIVLYR